MNPNTYSRRTALNRARWLVFGVLWAHHDGKQIHARLILLSVIPENFLASKLVSMYSKSGQIHHARKVFDEIPHRNIFSFNAMLIAYSSHDQHSEALRLFSSLSSFKPALKPDSFTISSLLKALLSVPLPHPILGKEIHASMLRHGFDSDLFVTNAVVTFYQCSCMGLVIFVEKRMMRRIRRHVGTIAVAKRSGSSTHQVCHANILNIILLVIFFFVEQSRRARAEKDLLELQVVQLNVRKLEDELMSWKSMLKEIPDVSCSDDIPRKFASLQKELIDSMMKLGEISAHLKQLEVALESADLAKQHAETEAALAKEKAEESLLVVKRLELMVRIRSSDSW
ncbi:pentatricopeptide repeat-containing protein At1g08070, chloroplastic-like [Magnolia sinica]|uniref:pentatricopeptide repeat-containing protein At1g08070, chloroplastic-like n=1 Tax=Magnolia sinica TaxID=86752 RepID=UPI00265A4424|nr:pentatricopeptide repeat-containing protein At1g08070, chloroplastic-like [Magnolia sinica]